MAIYLDRSQETTTVQVLGTIPEDAVNDASIELTSEYDDTTTVHDTTLVQNGKWVQIEIPKSQVPAYGGQYDFDVFIGSAGFLSLSEITLSLSELRSSLLNIRDAEREVLISDVLAIVKGDDTISIVSPEVATTVTENSIETTITEYNGITVDRQTYHR